MFENELIYYSKIIVLHKTYDFVGLRLKFDKHYFDFVEPIKFKFKINANKFFMRIYQKLFNE